AYLGTYLSRRGFTFDYINLFQMEKDKLKEKLEKNKYLTIAVTTTIYNFDHPILEVISFIRKYDDKAKLIVGGPYISKRSESLEPENLRSLFKYIDADFYTCSREGEEALANIIRALKSNHDFSNIPNIAYKKGTEFIILPTTPELNSLAENMIDYTLFPRKDIGGFLNLRLSKGCPYRCSFCGFPHRTVKYMYNSVECIKKELDAIRDIGTVDRLFFMDDTVNVPLKRFKEIMRMMIKEKYKFQWNCFFRCDQMDEEVVELMKNAGCEGVFLGLESANETILKNMNKTAGKEVYRKYIPLFKEAGITIFMSVFTGFPGETVETFWETMNFLKETKADFYRPQLWYCDPMTPIWEQRERFGLKGYNFSWSHNTMDVKTACDLQEKAFLSLDMPIWVPDPGYNFISLYIMKQRGMTIEKQKKFLACFNAVVKEKILYPDKREISPGLLESLKRSCRFDEKEVPDMQPVLELSGSYFDDAEKFWLKEFEVACPRLSQNAQEDIIQHGGYRESSRLFTIEKKLLERIQSLYGTDIQTIFLAVYSVLLLRLNGFEDTLILTAVNEKEIFPLRLYPRWGEGFLEFTQIVRQKIQKAMKYHLGGFHILNHPLTLNTRGSAIPLFNYAYWVMENQNASLEERLNSVPHANRKLQLIFKFIKTESDSKIQFIYSSEVYNEEKIEKIGNYLFSIFNAICGQRGIRINEIELNKESEKHKTSVESHLSVNFNF
ncbi:MAG: radical SAM protein, partial [Acidobacteria bacterium]|nr:radical SAM protein [Acidobacteriota bacterium]